MLLAALAATLGAWAGLALGQGTDILLGLTIVGAALGAAASALMDRMLGHRLLRWVRGDHAHPAPRGTAFWGELGYRVEKALRATERELEAERNQRREFLSAIEASPNGVLLLDKQDRIEWCNSVSADHFGLDPQRDVQQRVTNLVRDPLFVAHLAEGGDDVAVEFPGGRGHGTLSVLVRRYGDGKRLVLSQDVTERERADAMRRDFVANVSHEIRTPLTVLAGFVETLANLPLTEPERRRVLALMEQQTARMQSLVADLLTLAQLEGSPRPAPDTWVAVQRLLDQAHAEAVPLSAGRHEIVFAAAGDAELAGSAGELQSALGNLVTNAVRYTPEGGRIDVRWVWRQDGRGAFEVRDNGVGIAREHLPRVTERFYRVDGSRSRDTGGTGLGLSIVKHVLQRHGGEIDIESEPGKGSCFRLVFPPSRVRSPSGGSVVALDAGASAGAGAAID
jgi:two-component system, OmpR family, phosphate regulon sensor histidine kinase PhoR